MKKVTLLPVPDGHKVKIIHVHDKNGLREMALSNPKKPPRYVTYAMLLDNEGMMVDIAIAACSPRDTPSRKLGRAIAHNRLLTYYYDSQKESSAPNMALTA